MPCQGSVPLKLFRVPACITETKGRVRPWDLFITLLGRRRGCVKVSGLQAEVKSAAQSETTQWQCRLHAPEEWRECACCLLNLWLLGCRKRELGAEGFPDLHSPRQILLVDGVCACGTVCLGALVGGLCRWETAQSWEH